MDYHRDDIKAGVVIVACMAILGLFIFKIGDFMLFKNTYEAKIAFNVAGGLELDSSVMFAGVPVGEIVGITIKEDSQLTSEDDPRIVFTVSIEKGVKIKKDSKASIKTMGLMGEKYIEITPGSIGSVVLGPEDPPLLGDEPFDLEQLLMSGKKIVDKIDKMLDNVADFLADKDMIASLKNTVSNFEKLSADARGMIAENREDIRFLIKNLASTTDGLKEEVDNVLGKLESLLINADSMIAENRQDIRGMVKKFREASEYFSRFAAKIEAHPWMLLKKSPEEIKAEKKKKK